MSISINHSSKVISIPQSFLTLVSGSLYELDVNVFRLALKDLEDDPDGMVLLDTHRHNTEFVLSGVTYSRSFEIINGYTISFENTGSPYIVRCVGANHNIADVTNYDGNISLIIGNSSGLVTVDVGDVSAADIAAIRAKTDNLTFTSPGKVDSNVKEINDAVVIGTGQSNDKWRGDVL